MLTAFGASAVSFMMLMYALERHRGFILAFACGCALSSVYGFLAGTWPFGVVEAIWTAVALNRYRVPGADRRGVADCGKSDSERSEHRETRRALAASQRRCVTPKTEESSCAGDSWTSCLPRLVPIR